VQSSTALYSLLHELRDFMSQQITSRDTLVGKQETLEVNLRNLRLFYHKVYQMFSEFMRIQSKDHSDMISALIIDHFFKVHMLKVDEILANNNRIIQEAIRDQKFIVQQMKKEMEEEI
jgi:hypothetical protein